LATKISSPIRPEDPRGGRSLFIDQRVFTDSPARRRQLSSEHRERDPLARPAADERHPFRSIPVFAARNIFFFATMSRWRPVISVLGRRPGTHARFVSGNCRGLINLATGAEVRRRQRPHGVGMLSQQGRRKLEPLRLTLGLTGPISARRSSAGAAFLYYKRGGGGGVGGGGGGRMVDGSFWQM